MDTPVASSILLWIPAVAPLLYSITSAAALLYLSRKPIHLDQYDSLPEEDDQVIGNSTSTPEQPQLNGSLVQRGKGLSVSLARLGLTTFQLALALLSLVMFFVASDDHSSQRGRDNVLVAASQTACWAFALALTFVLVTRPAIAYQFWIRPQLDLFYVLEITLATIHLYQTDMPTLPRNEWPLWLQMDSLGWLACVLLLWTSASTYPYQVPRAPRKLMEGEIERSPSQEFSSPLYSRLTYGFINPMAYLGYKRPLEDVDLPNLEFEDISSISIKRFSQLKEGSFTRSIFRSLRKGFLLQILWTTPVCIAVNASPYFLNKIIQFIECEDCGPPTSTNYMHVYGLLASAIIGSLFTQAGLHIGRRCFVHFSSICTSEVFAKALRRKDMASPADKTSEEGDSSNKDGSLNISNLVAVDIKRLEVPIAYVCQLYGFPIQFLFASIQLYQVLGPAALVGVGFMVVTFPFPAKLYSTIVDLTSSVMNNKDERMDSLTEMLSAIRIVKFFGWEEKFAEKISATREKELQTTKQTYIRIVLADLVWMVTPLLNIIVVLLAYTKLFGNEISASKLFTTLALFNIMRDALNTLPWILKDIAMGLVSLQRLNRFLEEDELVKDTTITKIDGKARVHVQDHPTIGFVNATYNWYSKEQDQAVEKTEKAPTWFEKVKAKFSKVPQSAPDLVEPVDPQAIEERFKLKNLNVDFPVGKLSVIVGPTGSGKSALLLALLGELERVDGHHYLPRLDYGEHAPKDRGSGIAYVSQTAWLQNTTIRDNILFGRDFDQDRYDAVVEGCALIPDFEVLESGDATEIGEQGITLSGGQKQRVALARAVYSAATVLLLDDCLSAVDAHTGKQLFHTLTGPLLEGRTILMATHQVQLTLRAADLVVVMNKGEILGCGTPENAVRNTWVENVSLSSSGIEEEGSEVSTLDGEEKTQKATAEGKEKVSTKLTVDEKKVEGSVSWSVYKTYLAASGGTPFWIGLVSFLVGREFMQFSQNAWLAHWANVMMETTGAYAIQAFEGVVPKAMVLSIYSMFTPKEGAGSNDVAFALFNVGPSERDVNYYLGVYILLGLVTFVGATFAGFYAILGGLAASRSLHERLLHKVVRAKVRFFDTTPVGRIINRFSSDISTIDEEVNMGLQGVLSCFLSILGIILVISYNMPLFVIPAIFICAIYGAIGAFYVPVSRDLKRLNSNSRSPILNHFNESLAGLATIRAYGFENRFLSRNMVNVDNNNRTFFLLWSTNRWLHWRVDIAGAMVSFSTGMLVFQNYDKIASGWAALSLTYSLMFTGTIVWLIRIYAQNEMNLNSVERVAEYIDLEEEPAAIIEGSRPPAAWPHAGEIVVDRLTMKYALDGPSVIKDVSFAIKAGEKVGVVGRTGSGKSTLAISLFRFMDPVGGSITIDGIDISTIGLRDLRTNLTIIPQDPVLFKGTLRSNLDLFGECEDKDLWEALRRSHLIPESRSASRPASQPASHRNSLEFSAATSSSPAASIKGKSSTSSDNGDIVDVSKITLDTPVKEGGSNFSQGQRQLIALARALVRQSKIIVMDEATASVDFETDVKIQTTIREEMADSTIITIAHRIRTIADFDRVLVMDAGEVAEFDKPLTLMRREDSIFRSMCERSSEFDVLLAIAEEKERKESQEQA